MSPNHPQIPTFPQIAFSTFLNKQRKYFATRENTHKFSEKHKILKTPIPHSNSHSEIMVLGDLVHCLINTLIELDSQYFSFANFLQSWFWSSFISRASGDFRLLFSGLRAFSIGNYDLNFGAPQLENVAETRPYLKLELEAIAERHNVSAPASSATPQAGSSRSAPPRRSLVSFLRVPVALAAKWKAKFQ